MSQLAASVRSDMGINAIPTRDGNWLIASERSDSGVTRHPLLSSPFMKEQTRVTESLTGSDPDDYLIPKLINKTPELKQYHKKMQDFASSMEQRSREIIYSQQWGYTYTRSWRHEVEALSDAGRLTREDATMLMTVTCLDRVSVVAQARGLDPLMDTLLAAQRKVIAQANHKAYRTTAEALRDYTMRNKLDGFLDRFLPVHYWQTKSLALITRTAADRPVVAVNAGIAYDAWQQDNAHLPPTLRTGYYPINIPEGIPGIGGRQWHMRLTNITNPAVFALPRMLDPDGWNAYSDMSIQDRILSWSKDGLANFWSAAGYRVGPQWDYVTKASNAVTKYGPLKDSAAI